MPIIYPNPFSNTIKVTRLDEFTGENLIVLDLNGKEIFREKIRSNKVVIILSDKYPNGYYIVKVEGRDFYEKIVKMK